MEAVPLPHTTCSRKFAGRLGRRVGGLVLCCMYPGAGGGNRTSAPVFSIASDKCGKGRPSGKYQQNKCLPGWLASHPQSCPCQGRKKRFMRQKQNARSVNIGRPSFTFHTHHSLPPFPLSKAYTEIHRESPTACTAGCHNEARSFANPWRARGQDDDKVRRGRSKEEQGGSVSAGPPS